MADSNVKIKNTSTKLPKKGKQDWYKWSVYLDTQQPSYLNNIKKVVYHLHPTFPVQKMEVDASKKGEGFRLDGEGWGEFPIQMDIILADGRKITKTHYLSLEKGSKKDTEILDEELQ